MERVINIHIEALDEGGYLATSDEIQGLIAQGRTIQETIDIARDVVRKLLEEQSDASINKISSSFDYPLVIGA